jgi:AmmeMemoRadiSam system protein A
MKLTDLERSRLLEIARTSIYGFLREGRAPAVVASEPALQQKAGCFVTLHAGPELRGCIGTFRQDLPLCESVRDMAVAAATEDPRFAPVSADELPRLTIEISVLAPRRRISEISEIELGRHGLWVERGVRRGVLLPQVATEYQWDVETFLGQTCHKAGLPDHAWRDTATSVEIFEAEVFGEEPG